MPRTRLQPKRRHFKLTIAYDGSNYAGWQLQPNGRTVQEFVEAAFSRVGLSWKEYVDFDETMLRPAEVDFLQGDASKASDAFGWKPAVGFYDLVAMMVDADVELAKREAAHWKAG